MNFRFSIILLICFKLWIIQVQGQNLVLDQSLALQQYVGTWYGVSSLSDSLIPENPNLKMVCNPVIDGQTIQVEVFEKRDSLWKTIMIESISHDKQTDQIAAFGQNTRGICFLGKGAFTDSIHWQMSDKTLDDLPWMDVSFTFLNATEVLLKSSSAIEENNWEMKYIKQEEQEKCIGIQLVSVKDEMVENPEKTLTILGRMGFSFVETFVYNKGKFYDRSPAEFASMVHRAGMEFYGSMVFQNLPEPNKVNSALDWWKQCIADHASIGVKYLTTSNHQTHEMKTLADVQRFCDYYNAIGKLCQESGIVFAIHNHTEEFQQVDGKVIYDYFLENTNPNYVSFQTDLYWMNQASVDPIRYFQNYPGRFISWHVKDDYVLGESGKIDFDKIFSFADLGGIKYNLVEQEQFDRDVLNSVQTDYYYLKNNNKIKCYIVED